MLTIDFDTATNDDLAQAVDTIRAEIDRRGALEQAEQQIDEIVRGVLAAQGVEDGGEWRQPLGGHDSYPLGWTVTHEGETWVSLVAGNVWKPGDESDPQSYRWWQKVVDEPEPGGGPAAWNPNGHAYQVGDIVLFEGIEYECMQAHTSQPGWTPVVVPALWTAA